MSGFKDLSAEAQIESLKTSVQDLLEQYGLTGASYESINHEFNSTFKITSSSGTKFALRINVNSKSSLEKLNAEVFWVNAIDSVTVPKPVKNIRGSMVSQAWHEASSSYLNAVLYTWLDGEEVGDEPSEEQMHAAGVAMAKLHQEAKSLKLPLGAALPEYSDFFWGAKDLISANLPSEDLEIVSNVRLQVEILLGELAAVEDAQPIHADLHPWNMMWCDGKLSVFDFDDAGIGLRVQDLATSMYYLDTEAQKSAFLAGYRSVMDLPKYSDRALHLLLVQRRILLLNYLYETNNPEHRAMIPDYQKETIVRSKMALSG